MRRKPLIVFLGLLVVVLPILAGVWLWTADLGRFKAPIEAWLQESSGFEVRAEALSIELGPGLGIEARGVTVDNPGWEEEPRVLEVSRLDARIDLRSVFGSGPLLIQELRLDGLRAELRWNGDGEANFEPPVSIMDDTDSALPVLLGPGVGTDLHLTIDDPERDAPVVLALERLDLNVDEQAMIGLELNGSLNDRPVTYRGAVGPVAALMASRDVRFQGEGRFGSLELAGDLAVDDLDAPNRPIGRLSVSGPDIREVEHMLGLEPGSAGAYEFDLLAESDAKNWTLDLDGAIDAFRADIRLEADGLERLEQVNAAVRLSGPDLRKILRLAGFQDVPAQPFEVAGNLARDGASLDVQGASVLIGETAFDFDARLNDFPHLRNSRLRLEASGPDMASFRALFDLPGIAEGPFTLNLDAQPAPGNLEIVSGRVTTNLGELDITGTLSNHDRYVGSEVSLHLLGHDAEAIFSAFGIPGFHDRPFELETKLVVDERALRLRSARLEGLLALRVEASGSLGLDFWTPETDLDIRLVGSDLADSLSRIDVAWPLGAAPFDLGTRLRTAESMLLLDDITGTVGRNDLAGSARIPLDADAGELDVEFDASGPSLRSVLQDTTNVNIPDVDWAASGQVVRAPDRLVVRDLDLRVARVGVRGEVDVPLPLDAGAGSFRLTGQGPDLGRAVPKIGPFEPAAVPFELSLDGSVKGGAWRFRPSHLTLGATRIELSGRFAGLPDFSDTDLDLDADIPDLSTLGRWKGRPLPATPVRLNTHLSGSPERLRLDDASLALGDSVILGSVLMDQEETAPTFKVDVRSEFLDLRPFTEPLAIPPASDADEAENSGKAGESGERLIPDTPLPLEALTRVNAEFDIEIDALVTHRRTVNELRVAATLRDGAVELQRYHTKGMLGEFWAEGALRPVDDGRAEVRLEARAVNLVLDRPDWQQADPATLPKINATLDLSATGATVRDLAAGLDGQLGVVASAGTLPGRGFDSMNSLLLGQLLKLLVPGMERNEPTELRCVAIRLTAEDGLIRTDPLAAMRSDRLLILSTGTIDLARETLDLGFQTTPTRFLGISLAELINPFVRIRGTLSDPRAEPDPAGTLIYGGAAAATGGLSVIAKGLWDRLRGASNPCERLRDELEAGALGPPPGERGSGGISDSRTG